MRYEVTFTVESCIVVEVEAKNMKEAKNMAWPLVKDDGALYSPCWVSVANKRKSQQYKLSEEF